MLQHNGHGIAQASLLPPWDTIALGIQKFLTCKGRCTILYHYHFRLLAHLRHGQLINIPYFLYGMLKQMASHIRRAKHPSSSVNHHGLIKLLVLCSLEKQGRRWDEVAIVVEEGSVADVSAHQGGAMNE